MDLAQLTRDLDVLRVRATAAASAAPDTSAVEAIDLEVLRVDLRDHLGRAASA